MNFLSDSFASVNNKQFQDYFIYSFVNHSGITSRELKISLIAVVILTAVGLLMYGISHWNCQKEVILHSQNNESDIVKSDISPVSEIDFNHVFRQLERQTSQVIALPYHSSSCRFYDILCPKDTHVNIPGSTEALYLHANHVQLEGLHFIITQYPMPAQVRLFWQMSKQACFIVDLTNDKDMCKGLDPYAPIMGEKWVDNQLIVSCVEKQNLNGIKASLYCYHIEDSSLSPTAFDIVRMHYENWNDFEGIGKEDLDFMIQMFKKYQKEPAQPIVIHCRAGVGRSGTIAVAYAIAFLIQQGKVNASNLMDHISRLVLEGRRQRGPGFVQTPDQLRTIWNWSLKALPRTQ